MKLQGRFLIVVIFISLLTSCTSNGTEETDPVVEEQQGKAEAFCYQSETPNSPIEGDYVKNRRQPLASVSKIMTSLWAMERLGINHRFITKFHVTPVGGDSIDIHMEGSKDPALGQRAAYYIMSELSQLGFNINRIETLSFDENVLFDWRLEQPDRIGGNTPFFKTQNDQNAATERNLSYGFGIQLDQTQFRQLQSEANDDGILIAPISNISARRVEFKPRSQFYRTGQTRTFIYRSSPLHRILKNMNNKSNNYIADHLFWNLGGTSEFNKFIQSSLAVSPAELEFHLGSGNNARYLNGSGKDTYNTGTCPAVIKTMVKVEKYLKNQNLKLTDIMAVARTDNQSTLEDFTGLFENAVIAKTGTVNIAKTLAGVASTARGRFYFAVLYQAESKEDADLAIGPIKEKVLELLRNNGGPQRLNYRKLIPLPFDKDSNLIEQFAISAGDEK
ncbi:D-alanyl-D-alanine carboxypeptidase [Bdellovibrio reynosensis]|uniref:D-alanyl-D-alanine carboxypeptidase n=1 Tax=Bdellovibrio reynosensis TaxID=2835041 RepID=A0ABY4C747_9BACT|nr:D-alanyl-D-alanine carboxypeptidase [Bdellovibrio reynosensis]UOF00801.1 D-alanyl-D-alanine carboxypeptidase [Bdellovibrio reynosensis]